MIRKLFTIDCRTASIAVIAALAIAIIGCGGSEPETINIDASIEGRTMAPSEIVVNHDDRLVMNISSDEPGLIHIHGYDVEQEIKKGDILKLELDAYATGMYKIAFHIVDAEDHSSHAHSADNETESKEIIIGSLKVNPK